jgi:hypothetical protein
MSAEPAPTQAIEDLVARNPCQMSVEEYCVVWDEIARKRPCRLLVFGCGNDSGLWLRANHGGHTTFIEHNREWAEKTAKNLAALPLECDFAIKVVNYWTMLHQWRWLLGHHRYLLLAIENHWDIVLVDGPPGIGWRAQGRMRSIYTASRVASSCATIMVHDMEREVEQVYTARYLGAPTREIHKLAVWRREPHGTAARSSVG